MRSMTRFPVALVLLALAGCASTPDVPTTVDTTGMPNAELALRDSFQQVDREMTELGRTVLPSPAITAPADPVLPAELQREITFGWQGPLDDAVVKLANSIGYTVAIDAPRHAVPLPISVNVGPEAMFDVFRALGEAVGASATVQLDPLHHQVQVIHHV